MSRRLRVLTLIGGVSLGGAAVRVLSLARGIDRRRFEHAVVTIDGAQPGRADIEPMLQCFAREGVPVTVLDPAPPPFAPWKLLRRVHRLARLIERWDADVIDAHMESAALLGVLAAAATGRARVVTLYHPDPLEPPTGWALARQLILSQADLIVTDSAVRGREIRDASRLRLPDVAVIPNGIEPPRVERGREELLSRLRLPAGAGPIVGQVAALVDFKGPMVLLDAMPAVLARAPGAFLVLAGYPRDGGGCAARLARRARELGIEERVRIVPYPGSIGDVWNLIDVHAHASLFDSLPNAIIEAMAFGKPSVVTAVGGAREVVEDGTSGIVVPPDDPAALAHGLLRFIHEPGFARSCGEAARRRYVARHGTEVMARSLEQQFEQAAIARARRGSSARTRPLPGGSMAQPCAT